MGKQGAELRWWDQSSSSTVLLDPAALVESCKQQIQGKDGIPAEHQRLIFACRVANQEVLSYTCKRSSRCAGAEENAVSEFLKELRGWEAILKDDNHNIAKLLHPLVRAEEQVAAEDERKASQLSCQMARELRSMGIPCNVYYLFFDKWMPASLKNGKCCEVMRNVEIQIDKDFQARSFEILLFGRLSGSSLPLPFVFRMNGGEVAAQVYGLEQMAQYRQVQKTRHRLGLSTQSVGKGVEGRDVHTAVVENDGLRKRNGCEKSEREDDYYCPCGKDLDLTVIISNDLQLKCFVLKVIQVPANAGRKQEQIASHVSGRCDRGNSNCQHDSNKYCVSSSGGTSFKCENTVSENKAALAESYPTKCCQFAKTSSSLSRKVSYPSGSCPCPLDVAGPTDSSKSSTSDSGASPQNVYISSTGSSPEEGLPIVEEPSGTLSKKKKKKKRKGKRKGKLMVDTFSILDSIPGVSTINESLDSCSHTAVVECHRGGCEATCCSGSVRDGTLEEVARQPSTCGDKSEGGQVNIFRREVHCTEDSREDHGSSSMMRNEAVKIGWGNLTAEEILANKISDQKAMALSKESSKDSFGTNAVVRHGEDFLPVGRGIPWSAACLGTGSGSFENNLSQPFVGPIMVEMGLQKSSGLPARSSGDSRGSRYPSRELVGGLETVNDTNSLVDFSDIHFSARGGYNGSSGTGSRNGRSGADGSGNRSHGRGSEDNGNGNTSGYHGGGQGSGGSNHGGGPGGSSTSGSSGGSGGGNWNRGGGRGSSGGSWESRRSDDDGGNSSNDGDNDERYRNSFQAGSNGEASADSVPRKKGISSLDNRGSSNHGRKGVSGGVTADQLMNGTSSSHGSLATSTSSGKENIESWDDLAQESVPPSQSKIEDRTPRTRTDQKSGPPPSHMNGFLHHELPLKKDSNLMEKRDGVDHYQQGRATTALTQDSFVKVLKQSLTNNSQNKDDDYDHLCSSSSRGSSKENRSSGTAVPPGQQDSLKGAWQKKISWDDQRQQPLYDNNKYVPEGGTSQVGPSKEKLSVKSTRNGIQMRGSQSSDSGIESNTKSSSAPSTPNGPIPFYDNFADARESNSNFTRQEDGQVHQSTAIQAVKTASEHQVPQARMQAANTAAVQQPGEARSAPEESSQRLTMWKSRKPSGSDQERPVVREKPVDRERTTHWAQKWVPVEHNSGGAPGKGSGIQSSSGNGGPADGDSTGSRESEPDYVISKEIMGRGEESTGDEIPPSSSQSEAPPSSTSPSKTLRRLQTFPSDNINIMLGVSASEAGTYETRESAASFANERFGHPEHQANLRGLLPRERAVDNPSTQAATQSTAGGHSTPVQSPIPGEQKNKLILDDRSNKGSNSRVMVKPMLSPAEEKSRKVAMAILDAVQSSCRHRRAAEVAVREVGCPMAEFEKVLGAVAPSFFPVEDSSLPTSIFCEMESACVSGRADRSRGHSITCKGDEFSICRCRMSHIPLNSIWQWYKEPSYYGVEVRAVDCKKVQKNGEEDEESFLAYFVPYLSGLQIFGYSSYGGSRSGGELASKKGNVDSPLSAQSKAFSGSDMLATLFPTAGRCDDGSSHVRPSCTTCGQKDSSFRNSDTSGIQLLYEFYDTDVPQVRQPLFTKVQELVEGVSSINSYSRGRSTVLDELCLGDIHPASWFAVAWYPIYRISEGPLRATFLTYHSFDHFAPRSSLSCLMGGAEDVDDSISMPVVGLECYNLQGEPWLSMGRRFSEEATKVSGRLSVNPAQCLENRISSLEAVAAGMAKGIPDEKSATSADGSSGVSKFRHSDYEFFVKRRR